MVTGCKFIKKSGCTDSEAGNYDSNAKDDDGSCCYNRDVDVFSKMLLFDEFATSNHVAKFYFDQVTIESCDDLDKTEIRLNIENITSDTITFTFNVEMQANITTTVWSVNGQVNHLPPGDTLYYGVVSTKPFNIESHDLVFTGIWDVEYNK